MRIRDDPQRPTADANDGERTLRIFLNYRRDDSAGQAGRLYDSLVARFGENVFMDVDTIEPGLDFGEVVAKTVAATDVLLAVIGKRWLDAADEGGRSRLQNPDDFVRTEIRAALEREGTRVIPLLVQGAAIPSARDLPDDLVKLVRRNAVELRDASWTDDVSRLVRALERIAAEKLASEHAVVSAGAEERQAAEREAPHVSRQRARDGEVTREVPTTHTSGARLWPVHWASHDGPPVSVADRVAVWLVSAGLLLGLVGALLRLLGQLFGYSLFYFVAIKAWLLFGLLAVYAGGVVKLIAIGRRREWSIPILLTIVLAAVGVLALLPRLVGLS